MRLLHSLNLGKMKRLQALYPEIIALSLVIFASAIARGQAAVAVDPASVARGATIYAGSCAKCHGDDVRGTATGPDLLRSLVVLHDRFNLLRGSEMGPLLNNGPTHHFNFDKNQLVDISEFLTKSVNGILRSGYSGRPTQMLTGDKNAGEAYFNGAGGCSKCHSVTGDLAGIGTRLEPTALQQKFLFPSSALRGPAGGPPPKKVQVTVTLASGKSFSGSLVRIDDFIVTFRDASGVTRTFRRVAGMKVKQDDPFAAHIALLDKYTDADIHNLTTYLETLK
jgi:cytochrome c oxidase cbb3-type subunit 3